MPAERRYLESVAPVDIVGTTGTPGHSACVTRSTALMISGVRGDGGLGKNLLVGVTLILSFASARTSCWRTSSSVSFGSTRQFTTARAVCGSALSAWPPSSLVGTHVVRSCELNTGPTAATRATTA